MIRGTIEGTAIDITLCYAVVRKASSVAISIYIDTKGRLYILYIENIRINTTPGKVPESASWIILRCVVQLMKHMHAH